MFEYQSETYLHNTDGWMVSKSNHTTERFSGDKLKRAILSSIQSIDNLPEEPPVIGNIDKIATTVTIQVCNELHKLMKCKKLQKDHIPTRLIRFFCERELAITYFSAAKSYIVEGSKHYSNYDVDLELITELNNGGLGSRFR